MKNILLAVLLMLCIGASAQSVKKTENSGHSHNDYVQNFPFYEAYYAGMGSVEADVYFKKGKLLVAHNEEDTDPSKDLKTLYLEPIAKVFAKNKGFPYADTSRSLQLLIDIKTGHKEVLEQLIKDLKPYLLAFDRQKDKHAVQILISGDVPPAANFKDYPSYIKFDGRTTNTYTDEQLTRVGLVSESIATFTVWNGKGTPTPGDKVKLQNAIAIAHKWKKPFRFWGTKDNPNTWKELENMGADWIGTDRPEKLKEYFSNRKKLEYVNPKSYQPYQPTYKLDGAQKRAKNIIFLIGDGMGLAQIQAGLSANFGYSNLMTFKHLGLSRTEAINSDFTDSAAGATAMATGEKTNNRYISVDTNGKALVALPEALVKQGIVSGIISSGDITDATPAAFYAHQNERSLSQEIAADLLNSPISVLVGSNRKSFTANKNKNLLSDLKAKGFNYSETLSEFQSKSSGKQLVLLEDSITRRKLDGRGEMLSNSLIKTIDLLSSNKQGFFIMAEGAQIDHGGHANDLPFVITEQLDFDRVIGEALKFADKDGETLVIVTADHETGGLSLLDASAKTGMVRGNFSTDDHTNIMVPVFAYGPGATNFMGTFKNKEIYTKILKAFARK